MAFDSRAFAIILAGGRSSRMGRDKATLPLGGRTLVERVVAELRRAFSPIIVVGAMPSEQSPVIDEAAADIILVRDRVAGQGPVHALRRGLEAAGGDYGFVASCDLPMLRAAVALKLCAMLGPHDAVIPRIGGRLQMLHAVYRGRCLGALAEMEDIGERRLHTIVERIDAQIVGESEMRAVDPKLESFINVNTPEDYARARATIERS